jgi:hypothetical protein
VEFVEPPVLVDRVDYLVEFEDPAPVPARQPVFVDQVDYLVEFIDPGPAALDREARRPLLQDRVDQVVEFAETNPAEQRNGSPAAPSPSPPVAAPLDVPAGESQRGPDRVDEAPDTGRRLGESPRP